LRCLAFQVSEETLIIHPSFLDSTNLGTRDLIISLSVVVDSSKYINIHVKNERSAKNCSGAGLLEFDEASSCACFQNLVKSASSAVTITANSTDRNRARPTPLKSAGITHNAKSTIRVRREIAH